MVMMRADFENTAIVVPAYNAAKYLDELIRRIARFFPKQQIIIIDDSSDDDSFAICKQNGVIVHRFTSNRGKGAALQQGFNMAIENGYQYAFTIDSDLQHQPEDFPIFIERQNVTTADMVIGCRALKLPKMPFLRVCSNRLTSSIVSLVVGSRIYDSQSGFRLYKLEPLKKMRFRSQRYQFETEVIIKTAKQNGIIDFVPIEVIYDGQSSHISHMRDIANFVRVILSEITNKMEKA